MRRWLRRLGTALVVIGILFLAYGATVYFWRDPVTDLYARWKQREAEGALDREVAAFREAVGLPLEADAEEEAPQKPAGSENPRPETAKRPEELAREVRRLARRFLEGLELGQAFGRLEIRKLGLETIAINGTRWGADLSRGPGRYPETSVPGLGTVTAIAGHRTTFGAPFRHIDQLRAGDTIRLELAYGTFDYEVVGYRIVDDEDWSIIRPQGYDALVLSACHPLYSASKRWVVYARLRDVRLPDGRSYELEPATSRQSRPKA